MKRKRRKPRLKGTACVLGKRCVATEDYRGFRLCIKHAADMMMADLVKSEEGECRRCKATESLQWAHVFSRRYGALRWERSNSMALCAACHYYMTGRHPEVHTSFPVDQTQTHTFGVTVEPDTILYTCDGHLGASTPNVVPDVLWNLHVRTEPNLDPVSETCMDVRWIEVPE